MNLSTDARTIELVQRAVANMTKIQTLRIVFGHPTLSEALVRCIFDATRVKELPLRRLWLENVRITPGGFGDLSDVTKHPYGLPLRLNFSGLESVRYRRSPLWLQSIYTRFGRAASQSYRIYLRGYHPAPPGAPSIPEPQPAYGTLQNGEGGLYETPTGIDIYQQQTSMDTSGSGYRRSRNDQDWYFDEKIYGAISQDPGYPSDLDKYAAPNVQEANTRAHEHFWIAGRATLAEGLDADCYASLWPLKAASHTLTSLNLDWILPGLRATPEDATLADRIWPEFLHLLFSLRFSRLRAFQLRNAVVPHTKLPDCFYLLDEGKFGSTALEFMEAHQSLQCLAWPMDHFFNENPEHPETTRRADAVIDRLAETLTDLRIDTLYSGNGEAQSEESWTEDRAALERRRTFISRFAAKLSRLQSIKIEGGMPRDERRETIRALRHCPLRKIVLIGVTSPIGNTWGLGGRDLPELLSPDETADLEAEDKDAVFAIGPTPPQPPVEADLNHPFTPAYGWPASPPMLHTLASNHAATITELKFCGYKGSACLYEPTPITSPLLAPLKHFHNLEMLVLSTWLSTLFEHAYHDQDIIAYWLNTRDPASTALVPVSTNDEDLGSWALALKTRFAPLALARRVVEMFGAVLSERAKGKKGGVKVRASFCLGDWGGIFDIDVVVGKGAGGEDVLVGFEGPREELEATRRRDKLEGRRWFY